MEVPQRLMVHYRVRFDEADASGQVRPSNLLRYTQDIAWQHSEAAGFDREWYDRRGTGWLVRNIDLRVTERISYGDALQATTEITGWRRVWARRHTVFTTDQGQQAAEANTDWVLLTKEGRPTRIPEEMTRYFAPGAMYRPDSVEIGAAPPGSTETEVTVRDADVDPMGHLNNAAYLDLVDAAVAAVSGPSERPTGYRAEFVRPALPHTSVRISAWRTDEGLFACRMTDMHGEELFRSLVST